MASAPGYSAAGQRPNPEAVSDPAPTPSLSQDAAIVLARQENLETIHQHNVVAERYGLLEEIRSELATGQHSPHHLTMREWLESPGAAPA